MTSMMKRIKVIFMVNEQSSQEGNKESNFNITQQRQNTKSQYIAIISTTPKQRQICYHGHFFVVNGVNNDDVVCLFVCTRIIFHRI